MLQNVKMVHFVNIPHELWNNLRIQQWSYASNDKYIDSIPIIDVKFWTISLS